MPQNSARGYGSRWASLAGIATAATGLFVLAAWNLHKIALIQPAPSLTPMFRNTAAGLLCCGMALTLLASRRLSRSWVIACAAPVALLAVLTLLEYAFSRDFAIDLLLGPGYLSGSNPYPGRMSPLTCICFLLTTAGLASLAVAPRGPKWLTWLVPILATVMVPIALTGLLSEVFGISTAIGWMRTAPMSSYAAACFLLLASGLIVHAWLLDRSRLSASRNGREAPAPLWAPYCIAAASTLSLLWLMNGETAQLGTRPALIVFAESALTLLAIACVPMDFRSRMIVGVAMAVVIVLLTELYSFRTLFKNDQIQAWVEHTHVALGQIDLLAIDVAEAEAAYRSYRWTGQPAERQIWLKKMDQFNQGLTALESFTADNPRQVQNIRQIFASLQRTTAAIDAGIQGWQEHASLDEFRQDQALHVLKPVQELLEAARSEESRLLRLRILAAEVSSRQTKLVVVLGNIVAVSFLAVLVFMAAAEMRGRVKEKTFRGLLESAPDAIVVADSRGKIVLANARTEKLFGYAREELLQQEVDLLMPQRLQGDQPAQPTDLFLQAQSQQAGIARELFGRRKDGTEFPIELSLSPLETEGGRLVSGAIRDITEHRRIEQQLKSLATALSQQAALLDVVPDSIMVRDMEGVISFWNRGAETTYGFTRQEAIGKVSHDLLQTRFPLEQAGVIEALNETGKWEGELNHCRKDGSRLFVASRWVLEHTDPDAPLKVLEINNDITARKQADDEIRRLNTELGHRINELTAMNQELEAFTYTAAHDLRAPLRHMHGFAGFLRSSWYDKLDDDGRHCLDKITASSRGMGQLLDDLLNFSRLGRVELQMSRVNLARVVEQIRQELEPEVKGRSLTWDVTELPEVAGDLSLLHQVLFNLMANAVKYTSKRQDAHIEIGSHLENEENVTVFVRDNGAGFQMEYADKLFGVFQRLHKSQDFEGTGIGLAIVRRIVERHGGRAWAQGCPGKGATFYVSLPMKGQNNGKAGIHLAGG
jgi:PAS domain S-box-containing protein